MRIFLIQVRMRVELKPRERQLMIGGCIETVKAMKTSDHLKSCLTMVENGLQKGFEPRLSEEGTSGSYFLSGELECGEAKPVAVFKPIDEEPFAPNNPRDMQANFGSETCRPGVKSGESTFREVYAYLLDHDGFAGVPPTAFVQIAHPSLPYKPVNESQIDGKEIKNLISGFLPLEK